MKSFAERAIHKSEDRRVEAVDEALDPVIRRLKQFGPLSEPSLALIKVCGDVRLHPPGAEILKDGEAPRPLWLISGWACRQKLLEDGRRQIISFVLPGDCVGWTYGAAPLSSCGIAAVSAVTTAEAATAAQALPDPAHSDLRHALDRQRADDEARLFDQIVRLGRLSAFERVSRMLFEFHARLAMVGLAAGDSFELPLTQEVLADAAGLSIVHVNRTLQQMRREGVIELRGGHVRVLRHPTRNAAEGGA